MKIRHGTAIVLSGTLWIMVGVMLLFKGFSLLLHPAVGQSSSLLPFIQSIAGKQEAPLVLVCLGLLIGFLKGRFVLAKTAERVIRGIVSQPNPLAWNSLYSRGYLMVLLSMAVMGMSLRWIPVPYDLKGLVDVAVGSALTNGSAFYFRYFAEKKKKA